MEANMPGLYYWIRLTAADGQGFGYRDFRLPSKHPFPSPVGTELHIWYGEDRDQLFEVIVSHHQDDLRFENFYMRLDDGNDDPHNIEHDDVHHIIKSMLEDGWEMEFMVE